MNLLDEEKDESRIEKEKEQARQIFDKQEEKSASRFSSGPDNMSSKYDMSSTSGYSSSSGPIIDDQDYKKSSKGPLFILLFAIIVCAGLAWYFLVGPGEKKSTPISIKTLFDQPVTTADSVEAEADSTDLEMEPPPESETLTSAYVPSVTGAGSSSQNLADISSAAIQALPSGGYPSVLTLNSSGYLLTEIFAVSRADLASFKAKFERAVPQAKLKALSEEQINFLGRSYYRGTYSGDVTPKASGSGARRLAYQDLAEFKAQVNKILSNSGLRITNLDESKGRENQVIFIRSTGSRDAILKALSALASANLNANIGKANIIFDTTEPINDFVVLSMWLE